MTIRLLALDLDGTLLHSRGHITERNRSALKSVRDLGVHVAIVTGRRFRDARPIALDLGLDVPVIAHNGALTKHARTLETVAVMPLPLSAAQDAIAIGRSFGADPLVSDDYEGAGVLVYERPGKDNRALLGYIAWAKRIHGPEGNDAVRQVESLDAYLDHSPVHLAFSGNCKAMAELAETLEQRLEGRVKILITNYSKLDFALLDILHPEASKGVGVAATARELGVSREEVMAMGDNHNDLEMLHYAGTAVVMANAEPPLREMKEFHVTVSNDDDGVAIAIERFILNQ